MIEEKLQKFGLSQKEASVYTALQRLGTSVVSDIAKKASINRSTAYVLLDALAKRGLVSVSERGGIRVYSPAPTERFVQMAESSLAKWSSLAKLGRELLVEFKKESRETQSKPAVQLFEGVEGIKTAYEMLLIPKELSRSYSALSAVQDTLSDFLPHYRKRQATKGVRVRMIVPDTPHNRESIVDDTRDNCEYFLMPAHDYASDFLVSANTVAFISFDEPSALIIENTAFATLQKTLFDGLLNQARRSNIKSEVLSAVSAQASRKLKSPRKHPALVKATQRFFSM